ncbi:hypothetical protein DY000_02054046 [Brassica cretica]|uniref:VIP1 N-terminal domain-containing protein n=1 Tax=Brassica cretica TaxID=69181 RepID=A0ABQ7A5A4_BRACR|nr:hypothetical protein DY000_02054046 [Brassica cretica]
MWSSDCYLPRLMIDTPNIPQSQAYHDFTDQRSFFGNFSDPHFSLPSISRVLYLTIDDPYLLGILNAGLMNTREITESYDGFFTTVESLIDGTGDFSVEKEFMSHVSTLCKYGLDSLVNDHFLISLQQAFEKSGALSFSHHFDDCSNKNHTIRLRRRDSPSVVQEISIEKQYHDKCMSMETLAFTLVACHLELVPETLSVFSADTEVERYVCMMIAFHLYLLQLGIFCFSWPICDCLIAFHSSGYPLEKVQAYYSVA